MAVVRISSLYLTCPGRQQVLQSPKTILDPVAPLPCSYKPWPADGGLQTHYVELLLLGSLTTMRVTAPYVGLVVTTVHSASRHLLAFPPRPGTMLQIVAFDLSPIGQFEDIGTLPFHQERTSVGGGHSA